MASSGYTEIYATRYDILRFSWEINSQSIPDNISTIDWKLELIALQYGYITPLYNRAWNVSVDGNDYSGKVYINIDNWETVLLASGSTDISHNADGSKTFSYSFSQNLNITFSGEYIGTVSGSGTGDIDDIPRAAIITDAPDFNDEENPTITYYNGAGDGIESLQACIAAEDGITIYVSYRDIDKNASSYTFELTDDERTTLRKAAAKNTLNIRFYLKTVLNGETYLISSPKTLTIINAKPTLIPTVKDIQIPTLQLTGDENVMIKGFSIIEYDFGATAYKEATIESYSLTCGSKSGDTATGELPYVENNEFNFTVTDSRGNTLSKTITMDMIDYLKLTCNQKVEIDLVEETQAQVNLTIKGNCFNGSFGAQNNSVSLSYRYGINGGELGDWITVPDSPTLSGNTYSVSTTVAGLDYNNSYTFQSRVADMVAIEQSIEYQTKLIPVFDWSETDFNFNVPINMNGNAVLRATDENKVVLSAPEGDIYIRPNGSTTDEGQVRVYTSGSVDISNDANIAGSANISGSAVIGGNAIISGSASIGGNTLIDFIVEEGTESMGSNGTWYWRKFNNGVAECWGKRNFGNMAVNTAWGYLYESAVFSQDFPSGLFNDAPTILNINLMSASGTGFVCQGYGNDGSGATATNTGLFNVVRPSPSTLSQVYFGFHAIGTWK